MALRLTIVLAAALVAGWLLADTLRDFSEAVRYFSSQPHALLYVVAIALVGGLAALGFDRLSACAQRQVRVFAWGAAASAVTVFVGYFAFRSASLSSVIVESGGSHWVWLALLLFAGIAAYLWFEFYRAMKTGV
jgi:hypothetical protein